MTILTLTPIVRRVAALAAGRIRCSAVRAAEPAYAAEPPDFPALVARSTASRTTPAQYRGAPTGNRRSVSVFYPRLGGANIMSNELSTQPERAPAALADFAMSAQDVLKQAALIQQVMGSVMKDGEHYGIIPGTAKADGSGKKSLLKSGAEKLCFVFGLSNKLEIQVDNLPGLHREYRIICNLFDRGGNLRGQGVGSASTMESKHRYRGAAGKACPKCGAMACKASKKEYGGGYYCDQKGGGCGWQTKANTPEAKALDQFAAVRQENTDPADQYNTVLKMAKKRALVDAVLTATAASDIFAQDLEDLEDKIDSVVIEEEPAKAQPARTAPAASKAETQPAKAAKEEPAPTHPAISAARELYRNLGTHGRDIIARVCRLHGANDPKGIHADKLDAFGKDVADLMESQGELAAIEDKLGGWELAAREEVQQ
jgi:hypothetical protein